MNSLHVYLITWNSADFIKDTLTWYRQRVPDCLFTVYDNMSSDLTVEICNEFGAEVISFNTNGTHDEKTLMNIRELCWKNPEHESTHIVVCDDDEWVNVSLESMEGDWNVNKCIGYELFGEDSDTMDDLIFGVESIGYAKQAYFRRDQIERMNFGAGSHNANPIPKEGFELKYNPNPVEMFHTKWRGWNRGLSRQYSIAPRRSEDSKSKGWNFHYSLPESVHKDYYQNGFNNRIKVR